MAAEQRNYGLVADLGALEQFVDRLVAAGEPIGFDIETGYRGCSKEKASLHPEDPVSMVVGFSFTNSTAWARYVPLAHDGGPNLDPGEVAPILWRLLSSGLAVAHNCFSGGTEILTGEGMVPLGSVAGREVEVWDGARWRKAPVRSFGRQRTREVVLAPWNLSRTSVRRSYRATDGHRWPVQRRATGPKGGILSPVRWEDRGFVTTDQLQPGDRIPGAVPTDIPDEYSDAFIHGLFYADGARASRQPKGDVGRFQMRLCGDKARFADRFEKVTYPPSAQGDPVINWYPSTVDLKELPYDPSPGYARDFIAGWAALDGADATAGPARIVSTVRESDVAWLHRYAALGGYTVTGSSGPHMSSSSYGGSEFWQVVLVRGAVDWVVKEVGESGDFEEVFCATVPESETFALDAGILTGNCKFEARWMATFFREFLPDSEQVAASNGYTPWFSDTMLESYVAAEFPNHGLKYLTKEVFGHEQADLLSLFPGLPKNRQKSLRFNELELTPAVVAYACEDAAWCLGLHEYFFPKVKDSLIFKTEMKVMEILCRMEDEGVCFDWAAIASAASEVEAFSEHMQAAIKAELSELVGREIDLNLGSPAQVGKVLYEDLGLPASNLTDTGKPSTNAAALGMLASEYPVVQAMLDWKEVNTLLTRYLVKFPAEFNYALDNRAHPNHMQAVVPSGRFSVNDPAYQQLPKKYHYEVAGQVLDLNFRDFLIAPEGWRIVGFDYSQVELRVLAGESGEPALLEAFAQGEDVHQATASLIFATPKEQVSKDQRQKAKGANFSLMYGAGPKNLSEQLRISIDEARELYETYFRIYSSVGAWKSQQIEAGKARGYVTTKFGRRVTIREFASPDHWIRSKGERLCINAPIQGAAADYMKIAMVRADAALKEAGLSEHVRLVMNIHDALEFYVRDDVPTSRVIEVLDPAVSFEVPGFPPILAEWHEGTKWGSVEEIEADNEAVSEQEPAETAANALSHSEGMGQESPVADPAPQVPVSRADSGPGTVFVDLLDFPYADEFEAFLGWLRGRPGDAEVVVRVADEQVPVGKASLSVSDSGEVATILTGAVVVLGADAVDLGTLGEGL